MVRPWARRMRCGRDGERKRTALFAADVIDKIGAFVFRDLWRPIIAHGPLRTFLEDVADVFPRQEIARLEDRKERRPFGRCRSGPIFITDTNDRWIGVVARHDGIGELELVRREERRCEERGDDQYADKLTSLKFFTLDCLL